MSIPAGYQRVSQRLRCPVCGKPRWCMIALDRATALCPRVSTGSIREWGECGFLHILDRLAFESRQPMKRWTPPPEPEIDAPRLAERFASALDSRKLELTAASLNLTVRSLRALGIGWSEQHGAFSFPMRDGDGTVVGIRLRSSDGRKWAVRGSRSALFYAGSPNGQGRVLVTEGPTDTAALMDLGFYVIGRPFCSGGRAFLVSMAQRGQRDWVVVSDRDGPGTEGAQKLADELSPHARSVRVIWPLAGKDARQWVQEGATYEEVRAVIANAKHWVRRVA